MRNLILILVGCLGAANPSLADDDPRAARPNIVLILADDFGYECVLVKGGDYRTPNLDALAAGGTRFTRCHATPLCTPSRVQLMTGGFVAKPQLDAKPLMRNWT